MHGIALNLDNNNVFVLYQDLLGNNEHYLRSLGDFFKAGVKDRNDNRTGQTYRFEEATIQEIRALANMEYVDSSILKEIKELLGGEEYGAKTK